MGEPSTQIPDALAQMHVPSGSSMPHHGVPQFSQARMQVEPMPQSGCLLAREKSWPSMRE